MGRYNNILEKIYKQPADYDFEKLSEDDIKREAVDGVPQDYIDFIREVGCGTVQGMFFNFFGVLVEATEFYDDLYDEDGDPELKDVLLFGNNFTGDAVGFLTTDNWSIVEIWHDDNLSINPREEKSFEEFVRNTFSKFS